MQVLRVSQIGNSLGVVLPKEMTQKMKVAKGDQLFVTETFEGYSLSPYNPSIEEEIAMGQEFMNAYRETFKVLAK